jgi:hypothetical protein
VRTWLVVAAEEIEFSGILKRCGPVRQLNWPGASFAREALWKNDRWWLIANGPGATLVSKALGERRDVEGIISTGFCGALDPTLALGAIVAAGETPVRCAAPFVQGGIYSADRVAVTAEEKRALRQSTGLSAVDMEFAEVSRIARVWGVPVRGIRVVSDTAPEDLPLDFNRYRDAQGRFSRGRIALAALGRPFTAIPGLLRLNRNCNLAADKLGEFFANCEF